MRASNRLATRPIITCVSHAVIFPLGSYLYIEKCPGVAFRFAWARLDQTVRYMRQPCSLSYPNISHI